jgi:hypothetical protein
VSRSALILTLALALIAPATAGAQQPGERTAPPGNSAIDEYVETVPGSTGARPPRRPSGGTDAPASTLAPKQRQALEAQGEDGKALAALVDATGPDPAPERPQAGRTATSAGTSVPTSAAISQLAHPDEHADSPLKTTLTAALAPNDAGGLGVFFPLILLASLLGVIALGVRRRLSA